MPRLGSLKTHFQREHINTDSSYFCADWRELFAGWGEADYTTRPLPTVQSITSLCYTDSVLTTWCSRTGPGSGPGSAAAACSWWWCGSCAAAPTPRSSHAPAGCHRNTYTENILARLKNISSGNILVQVKFHGKPCSLLWPLVPVVGVAVPLPLVPLPLPAPVSVSGVARPRVAVVHRVAAVAATAAVVVVRASLFVKWHYCSYHTGLFPLQTA